MVIKNANRKKCWVLGEKLEAALVVKMDQLNKEYPGGDVYALGKIKNIQKDIKRFKIAGLLIDANVSIDGFEKDCETILGKIESV